MSAKLTLVWQWLGVLPVCAVLWMSGCAGKPPTDTLSQAELAVQEADSKTASQYAPLELRTAREQLEQAKRALAEEEYDEARRLAEQALVNAQLAEARSAAEKARQAAAEIQKSIQALQSELQRSTAGR